MPDLPTILDGRYELLELLGRSPERATWRARRVSGGADEVAIKELLFRAMGSWKTLELFEREARTLRELAHPAVPRLIDSFAVTDGPRSGLYLVRELVRGASLEHERRARAHGVREVAAIAAEILDAVADLHALGIVHRDLTLSNVLRREDGRLVLVDLGAIKDAIAPGGSTVAGTYGFMAPEQLRGAASPASDVYGAGAIALSLLARRPIAELLDAQHRVRVADHVARGPMRRLLQAMLAPRASDRPSARAAARAMEAIARGEARSATVPAIVGATLASVLVLALGVAGGRAGDDDGEAHAAIELAAIEPAAIVAVEPVAIEPVAPIPPRPEPRTPPELEGWAPRCAREGCTGVEEAFAGISLDGACAPLVPPDGVEAPRRSAREDRIELEVGARSFSCEVEQQSGAFCNVLCRQRGEDVWGLSDELRAWIGDRHGRPADAREEEHERPSYAGIPASTYRERSWTWRSGGFAVPEVLLQAHGETDGRGEVVISYRGSFRARRGAR